KTFLHFALRDFRRFFFSSRRRHTRLQGDWSSDVCSSDLHLSPAVPVLLTRAVNWSRQQKLSGRQRDAFLGAVVNSIRFRLYGDRSEERRVGKECRSRWVSDHYKKK